jgi:ATP-dependent RNA helicase DDX5/DBP2
MAFAIGKVASRKEREQAVAFREWGFTLIGVTQIGATTVWVDDKYKHMIATFVDTKKGEGVVDDTWEYWFMVCLFFVCQKLQNLHIGPYSLC